MTNLTNPTVGRLSLQRKSTILEMPQGALNFSFFFMQLKHADNTYSNINELYWSQQKFGFNQEKKLWFTLNHESTQQMK